MLNKNTYFMKKKLTLNLFSLITNLLTRQIKITNKETYVN